MKRFAFALICSFFLMGRVGAFEFWSNVAEVPGSSAYVPVSDPVIVFENVSTADHTGAGVMAWIGSNAGVNYVVASDFTTLYSSGNVTLTPGTFNAFPLSEGSDAIQPSVDMFVDVSYNYYIIVEWLDDNLGTINYATCINGTWSSAASFTPSPELSLNPSSSVTINGGGYGLIAYSGYTGTYEVVQVYETSAAASGGSWTVDFASVANLSGENIDLGPAECVKIASLKNVPTTGAANVVWYQENGGVPGIYNNEYDGSWPTSGTLLNAGSLYSVSPEITIVADSTLDAYIIAWTQHATISEPETAVYFTNSAGTTNPLWVVDGASGLPSVQPNFFSPHYYVLLAAPTPTGFTLYQNEVVSYNTSPSWADDTILFSTTDAAIQGFVSGADQGGNYVVSWFDTSGICSGMIASEAILGDAEVIVESGVVSEALAAQADSSDIPVGIVALNSFLGMSYAYYPSSSPPIVLLPPTDLSGMQLFNKFPFQWQYYNGLSWTPSVSTGKSGYKIRRNGVLIGTSPIPSFTDQSIQRMTTYTYEVTTYNTAGIESEGAFVTISVP